MSWLRKYTYIYDNEGTESLTQWWKVRVLIGYSWRPNHELDCHSTWIKLHWSKRMDSRKARVRTVFSVEPWIYCEKPMVKTSRVGLKILEAGKRGWPVIKYWCPRWGRHQWCFRNAGAKNHRNYTWNLFEQWLYSPYQPGFHPSTLLSQHSTWRSLPFFSMVTLLLTRHCHGGWRLSLMLGSFFSYPPWN